MRLAPPQSHTTVGLGWLLPGAVGALTRHCTCSWCVSSCDGVVRRSCDAFRYTLAAAATPVQQVMGCECTHSITARPYNRLAAEPDTQNTHTWSLFGSHTCMARDCSSAADFGVRWVTQCVGAAGGDWATKTVFPGGMEVHSCVAAGRLGWLGVYILRFCCCVNHGTRVCVAGLLCTLATLALLCQHAAQRQCCVFLCGHYCLDCRQADCYIQTHQEQLCFSDPPARPA